jgi:hypothetical protein
VARLRKITFYKLANMCSSAAEVNRCYRDSKSFLDSFSKPVKLMAIPAIDSYTEESLCLNQLNEYATCERNGKFVRGGQFYNRFRRHLAEGTEMTPHIKRIKKPRLVRSPYWQLLSSLLCRLRYEKSALKWPMDERAPFLL